MSAEADKMKDEAETVIEQAGDEAEKAAAEGEDAVKKVIPPKEAGKSG